jgi:hypothetical protein
MGDPAPSTTPCYHASNINPGQGQICGSEFIREGAGTFDASSLPGTLLSRMNSLPQKKADLYRLLFVFDFYLSDLRLLSRIFIVYKVAKDCHTPPAMVVSRPWSLDR